MGHLVKGEKGHTAEEEFHYEKGQLKGAKTFWKDFFYLKMRLHKGSQNDN